MTIRLFDMKNPAFLFYSSDFMSGVTDLTMEERGQFITLLCIQHQKGSLSEKTIRLNVGSVSVDVLAKFKQDEDGNYYNERLKDEIEKRNNFTESRKNNGNKGGRPKKEESKEPNAKTYGKPNEKPYGFYMNNHMENENENINDNEIKKENTIKTRLELDSIEVLEYLNLKANRKFEITTKSYLKNIQSRLKEKNEKQILMDIIDMKCLEWLNTDFEKYLTPSTLFNNEKFYKYVEQLKYAKENPVKFIKFNAAETKVKSEMQLYKESLIRKNLQNEQQ